MTIVTMTAENDPPARTRGPRPPGASRPAMEHLAATAYAASAALAAVLLDRWIEAPNLSLLFVLPVMVAALRHGFGSALTAAVLGVSAYNYLLIEPRYTFEVGDIDSAWALILLLTVAAAVSAVAAQARRRTVEARDSAARAESLQVLARELTTAGTWEAVAEAGCRALSRVFGTPIVVLLAEGERLELAAATQGASLSLLDEEAARWALATGQASRAGFFPIEESRFDFWPVQAAGGPRLVIGAALADEDLGRPPRPEAVVSTVADHLSAGFERQALAMRMLDVRLAAESQRLKSDLLAAVSHDLKTPLSTIQLTLQSLRRFAREHDAETRDALLGAAEAETARLSGLVTNLLDTSRLSAEAVTADIRPMSAAELIAEAMMQANGALDEREVMIDATASKLWLSADPALARTALANVLENAAKYAPEGEIEVRVSEADGRVRLDVLDRGPGFPADAELMFERFTRGAADDGRPPGTGLGLAVARGFMEAQGGTAEASARFDGPGARVRLVFQMAEAV